MKREQLIGPLFELDGNGQCVCEVCHQTNWTSFCYSLREKVICGQCMRKILNDKYVELGGIMEHIYIASPFFNDVQLERVKGIENRLQEYNISFFSPRLCQVHTKDGHFDGPAIFKNNVDHIDECTTMVAIIDDKDTGTAFEIGYALAKGKRVILVMHQSEQVSKTNIMLACAGPIVLPWNLIDEIVHENKDYVYIVGKDLE